jgi:hypothetical protein
MITDTLNILTSHGEAKGRGNLIPFQPSPLGGWVIFFFEIATLARLARDILGGRGILADHHVIRHLCDLEAVSTLEGTESMHTLIIGQDLTGIPAFS